jgi:peptidylprolyl isomerase
MRIVTLVLPVTMALLTLTGCVSRAAPTVAPPPSLSPVASECDASDIEVTGDIDEKPVVTLPTDCDPPTTLLGVDLIEGEGPQAVRGTDMEVAYVMIAWTDSVQVDTTWSGQRNNPIAVTNLGDTGWGEGMLGMREGGRRLIVMPQDPSLTETGDAVTIVYVVDATTVY